MRLDGLFGDHELVGDLAVVQLVWVLARPGTDGGRRPRIANHTWTHRRLAELDPRQVKWDLSQTQNAVEAITGKRPRLMRPPQGLTNAKVAREGAELGLSQVLWSVTAKDYATTNSELITSRVLEQASRDGIILLHDIYPGTIPAVPGIIDELKQRGFTFVTVSDLLAPSTPKPGAVYQP